MTSTSIFAGKLAFAATGGGAAGFLDALKVHSGAGPVQYLPAMIGSGHAAGSPCILYLKDDASFRLQLPNLMWVAYNADLGNLILTVDAARAGVLKLAGAPLGASWQILTEDGFAPVGYYADLAQPILTTNLVDGAQRGFTPTVVTPSLADIVRSKSCRQGDLTDVVLDGVSATAIDFTGADFANASLIGADLSGSLLTGARLKRATLTGIRLDRATLDQADMTDALLGAPSWGAPASAKGLNLTQCLAVGAVLGGDAPLDASGAILAGGDFTGAKLQKFNLTKAKAAGAILIGADLTGAVLDGADIGGAVANRAVLKNASMRNVAGANVILAGADLSNADLGQAQLGAKRFLFSIAAGFAADLDGNAFPTAALLAAFAGNGVTLDPKAAIVILVAGKRWSIEDAHGPYSLSSANGGIDVFLAAPDIGPAVLRGAICLGTRASGAGLSGVDLRGVQWYGANATLDHADLGNACLAGSLLTGTDFTQAFLSGADFSGAVLVQAKFLGCDVGMGAGGVALSLEGAQIQGCGFAEANLRSALLLDAGVALLEGVPLFSLPLSDTQYLTPAGIAKLAPKFAAAGYPLGATPVAAKVPYWAIDNSVDPNARDARRYLIRSIGGQLRVYNGKTFILAESYRSQLALAHPTVDLIAAFASQQCGLVEQATITPGQYCSVKPGDDATIDGAFGYPSFSVFPMDSELRVYGSTVLLLRDWPQYAGGLAFGATSSLDRALGPTCLGPAGVPMSWVKAGRISWLDFLTG